jgi:hypothetical protein
MEWYKRGCAGPRGGRQGLAFAVVLSSLLMAGCSSPLAVSAFAHSSNEALAAGPAIFRDIHGSCVRRHTNAASITPLFMPATGPGSSPVGAENPACAAFVSQGEGLTQASSVLASYFRAMEQLAAFNTSTISSAGEKAGENASSTAQLTAVQADSVGKLAGIVTQLFTEGYRRGKLLHFLREADSAVASVTTAFETVVSKDYESLLREEQQSLMARYQNAGDTSNAAILLLLNRSYTDDVNQLNRRRDSAEAYVQALQKIREGHRELAKNLPHLKGKELSLALDAYTSGLDELVPVLQKAF